MVEATRDAALWADAGQRIEAEFGLNFGELQQDAIERGFGIAATALGLGDAKGVVISLVENNAPAAKAGIKPGDLLTRVGDRAITSPAELLASVAALKPKSRVDVDVQRNGKTLNFQFAVAQRPRRPQPLAAED